LTDQREKAGDYILVTVFLFKNDFVDVKKRVGE
jgi:hypothetical protein